MDENALVAIHDSADAVDALLYRSLLEEAGIDVEERIFEADWFEGVRQKDLHSQILVRAEDAERAGELITAFHDEAEQGDFLLDNHAHDTDDSTEEER